MLISVALGAAVTAPVVYWLISGNHDLVAIYRSSIAPMAATFKATAIGLLKAVYAPLAFLFPLDAIVLLFPGAAAQGWNAIKDAAACAPWTEARPIGGCCCSTSLSAASSSC